MNKLSRIFSRLKHWLSDHCPVQCRLCYRWMFRKDSIFERTTAGYQVRLCQTCHANIFHPFTKAGKS
jgi:hypothetical protein